MQLEQRRVRDVRERQVRGLTGEHELHGLRGGLRHLGQHRPLGAQQRGLVRGVRAGHVCE
jgi:hypothetical protein